MDTSLDLSAANREALLDLIAEQQAVIIRLQRRRDLLEGKVKPRGSLRMPLATSQLRWSNPNV